MIEIQCSDCRFNIKAKDALAGKTVLCPECKAKVRIPGGEHDLEVVPDEPRPANRPRRRQMGDDDDDDDRPRRRFRRRPKHFEAEPTHIYIALGVFVVLLVLAMVGFKSQPVAVLVTAIGAIISWVGGIWLLVTAFKEDSVTGLLCLVVPFYGLYFVVTRWDICKFPFALNAGGFIILFIALIAVGKHEQPNRPIRPNRWARMEDQRDAPRLSLLHRGIASVHGF